MEKTEIVYTNTFLQRAGIMKRFLNYAIDLIAFGAIFGFVGVILLPEGLMQKLDNMNSGAYNILSNAVFAIFIGLIEGMLKGKTFGKYLTNTISLNEDGSEINFITGFKRGLVKAVPFCALTALSAIPNPWQDRWTRTVVIDIKLTQINMDKEDINYIGMKDDEVTSSY